MSTDLERYEQLLRDLPNGSHWAEQLDLMAATADTLVLAAEVRDDREASARWDATAMLLRTVAAAERGYILSDPCGDTEWLTASCGGWTALVWAVKHGTALQRAEALHAVYAVIFPLVPSGAALVLDDIAAAEMAVAELERAA